MKRIWLEAARLLTHPYDNVLDLRALETVSKAAFELIREGAVTPKKGMRKHAILVGDAQPGTVQLGLYALVPPKYEWRACRDAGEAARWLAWPDAAEVFAAVEGRLGRRAPPMVEALKLYLAGELEGGRQLAVGRAASALGASIRGLQRALTQAGSSFSDELDRARLDRACALLGEPAAKLEAVARAVGFTDSRALARLFQRLRGESPQQFRDRLR
jgi:AraC-like DNA-binding protein